MLNISPVVEGAQIETVRELLREYQAQLGIDLDYQGFQLELTALPGAYTPPGGRLLLALYREAPVGCAALRDAGGGRAEMKRLYVRSAARGLGVGEALARRVILEAEMAGYRDLVLDTLPTMAQAQHLYERLGFRDIPAYMTSPIAGTRFLGLTLGETV
jgi:ribosomal protein S18 acetylase RimI-like enzyme